MRPSAVALSGLLALVATACAPALKPGPASAAEIGRSRAPAQPVSESVAPAIERARAAWARRPDPAAVGEAERAFLEAAEIDETATDALVGAARAKAWLVERDPDPASREALSRSLVQTAQLCAAKAPGAPACDYWLGIALGVQARERPSTADASIKEMIAALRRADAADPSIDHAGPARVLAWVYLRAPGWPLGPGDPEAGFVEARRAVAAHPDHPPNRLALAEALEKNGDRIEARREYERALEAARTESAAANPDAAEWVRDAVRALALAR